MKVHRNLDNLGEIRNPVVTTGSFDGIHVGHQYIINRLSKIAREIGGESVLITFYPHPRRVLFPETREQMIYSQREKIKTVEKTGLNHLIIINFTLEFSKLSPMDFIRKILVEKIHVKKVVIGYDHAFGANREGNFDYLHELGKYYDFGVEEILPQDVKHVTVSSTKIRRALQDGEIQRVNEYLGFPYLVVGNVIHGTRLGQRIGFRTAKIAIDEDVKLLPTSGVYAVRAQVNGGNYKGLLNILPHEKMPNITDRFVNLHLIDFQQDIYDQEITINFIQHLRDEKKFLSVKSLTNQLMVDRQKVNAMKF